jgi:hypothetical protein
MPENSPKHVKPKMDTKLCEFYLNRFTMAINYAANMGQFEVEIECQDDVMGAFLIDKLTPLGYKCALKYRILDRYYSLNVNWQK